MKTLEIKEYRNIHNWIRSKLGKANSCSFCDGPAKRYDWALLKGKEYKRDVRHFIQLCRSCHKKYDFTEEMKVNMSELKKRDLKSGKIELPFKTKGQFSGNHPTAKAVDKFDLDGNKLESYPSMTEASNKNKVLTSSIANAISGLSKHAGGFIWKYKTQIS